MPENSPDPEDALWDEVRPPSDQTILAHETFVRDLTKLLATHPGHFVAYRGYERLGINYDSFALDRDAQAKGIAPDEYEVYYIAEEPGDCAPLC